MNELALFAGAGGGILGGKLLGWRTVCAVEWDAYARDVLVARQNDGCLEAFPIWDDIQNFDGRPWRGRVDVVSGGFPCQDISAAGKGAGIEGDRSGMWKHMARIIGEILPQFVFVENSPMLVGRGLTVVLGDLAEMGYDAEWGIVGAHHVAAPHKRDRIWIVAHSNGTRLEKHRVLQPDIPIRSSPTGTSHKPNQKSDNSDMADATGRESGKPPERERRKDSCRRGEEVSDLADACGEGLQRIELTGALRDERHGPEAHGSTSQCGGVSRPPWAPCECCDDWWCNLHEMHTGECPCPEIDEWDSDPYSVCHTPSQGLPHGATESMGQPGADAQSERPDWWATEPDVGRVAHGVAARVDRLRCIGNGQVPAVAQLAWNLLR